MLLIDEQVRRALETAGGDYMQLSLRYCDRGREPPVTPERFNAMIQNKTFTNGSDRDRIVIPRYSDTFATVIGGAETLELTGLGFGDPEAEEIIQLLRTCCHARSLDLSANRISLPLENWAGLQQLESLKLNFMSQLSGNIQ